MAHSSLSSSSSSDTEVSTCSKACLKSYESLKEQFDKQKEQLNKANLEIIGYQLGLESLEARIVVHEKNEVVYEESIAFLKYDVQVKDISNKDLKNQLEEALNDKDDLKLKLENFEESSKSLTKLINSQISAKDKTGLGYDAQMNESQMNESEIVHSVFNNRESDEENSPVNDRFKTGEGFHTVPPPFTGNYMPPRPDLSFAGLDNFIFRPAVSETVTSLHQTETSASKTSKESMEKSKTVRPSAPIIEDWESNSDDDCVFRPSYVQNKPKFINFVKSGEHVKLVNKENTPRQEEYPRKSQSPRILTKSGQVPVNTAKQSFPRAVVSNSTAIYVNTAASRPIVNVAKPNSNVFNKFNNVTTAGPKAVVSAAKGNRDNAVKSSACWIWRPKGNVIDHISKYSGSYTLKKFDYVDPQGRLNGCSRHMTINKFYLSDYQDIDGGFVAFAGSPKGGKITRKGKIKTGKLDFEDVYFVKELKFNFFSVLQIYDKKNSVLFTETECLILSLDFKLLDESQVLLKVPTQNNMGNLVRGLPSKLFENDHTCVACQKGKHHKASCKTKLVNSISQPLQMLHMDLFGPTFVKSLNKKMYYLVVTDNFIRCDNGTELKNSEMNQFCEMKGIKREFSVVRTPQQNRVAERKNITLMEATRTMLVKKGGASNKENDQNVQDFRAELDNLLVQQKQGYANSTNRVFTISLSVSVAGKSFTNADDLPTDPLMPDLKDTANLLNTGIFSGAYDDENVGAKADLNNLETTMNVSPIPTTRIHKDHPKDQIIGDINSATQTRRMTKISEEHAMRLVDLPKGKHAIGTKWVYRNKKDERGIVVRNKARLVAQGYTQEEGIDYDERWCMVWAKPPLVLKIHSSPDKVYRNNDLVEGTLNRLCLLIENGFRRGAIDKTLFIRKDKGDILLVYVYVDDIIFGSTKKSLCDEFEQMMHKKFQMSSMGELTFFLGLQIASILIETNKELIKDEEAENVDVHLYRLMIGSLMYLTASRPDIMFAVYACARFQVTPKTSHLHAMKRILRYLKGQPKLGLWYPRDSPFNLEAFSDSDYARASLERKSTTRGCQFLSKRLISWQCKKQTIVANSTTEAEYVTAANCCG
ncbi:putative ribonuclease H-like domain-containing protein [Tanacetum coccineum]|uniref:Ribonuclease H-like domain-containing protein n=1 Tax=Tanacetum coccineum TaxID=301880 RepID=A0ABQ5GHG3_9ASTR